MKKNLLYFMGILCVPFAIISCTSNNSSETTEQAATAADTVKSCYTANYEDESAKLTLNIVDSTKVTGTLVVNYAEKAPNNGIIQGDFKGDTLYVHYTFKTGENPAEYSNPLAFLKRGDTLTMGVGVIETSMGRSYFAPDVPINFERGKFAFLPEDCN